MDLNRPAWVEINLDNLAHNIKEVRRVTKENSLVTAVVKADGYGHGVSVIADTLLENGADRFAVATLTEGLQLRKTHKNVEILVFGYTEESSVYLAVENKLTLTIYTKEQAKAFNEIAKGNKLKIHIKLDTGMTRLGMKSNDETVNEIIEMSKFNNLIIEGIYTHFALADEKDKTFTREQVKCFDYVCNELEKKNIIIPIKHVSNSAAIIDMPEYNYNMVRAGIMLYGLYPSKEVDHSIVDLKEVMSLHCKISRVQTVSADVGVSYGHKYITKETRKIASLPLGYADGFARGLSFKAEVIISKTKVPIVGRICMDQCMIDVTGIDVNIGDPVVLFGKTGDVSITIDDIAYQLATINYEIVCMINRRVPRVYKKKGKIF